MHPDRPLSTVNRGAKSASALIIGITGQDGSYLAELLLGKGYAVHGLVRRSSLLNRARIDHLRTAAAAHQDRLFLHYGDLTDLTSLRRIIKKIAPQEVYHLAGQSHVGLSFEIPEVTCQENGMATLGLLEILRDQDYPVRLYNAASSEIFGSPTQSPQTETTPLDPVNPYGCAKAFALQLGRVYRQSYGLFVVNGITYNHESPRRGENFVTRKITLAAAKIKAGQGSLLELGNLDSGRDWGWAPDYVEAMWLALQAEVARDYVLATGRSCSVRDFAAAAFAELGLPLVFEGQGAGEIARRTDTGAMVLKVNPRFYRPVDAAHLVGDATLAKQRLGWSAQIAGAEVARQMARADQTVLQARGTLTS